MVAYLYLRNSQALGILQLKVSKLRWNVLSWSIQKRIISLVKRHLP